MRSKLQYLLKRKQMEHITMQMYGLRELGVRLVSEERAHQALADLAATRSSALPPPIRRRTDNWH